MFDSTHFVGYYKSEEGRWTIQLFEKEELPNRRFYWFGWIDPITGKVNPLRNNDRWLGRLDHVQKIQPDVMDKEWVEPENSPILNIPDLPKPPKVEIPEPLNLPEIEKPKVEMPELKNPVEFSEPLVFGSKDPVTELPKLEELDLDPRPGVVGVPTIMVYRMEGRVTVRDHLDTVVGLYDVSVYDHRMTDVAYISGNKTIVPEAYTQIGFTP